MNPDGKCIWKNIDEECNCDSCFNCEHYKELFKDLMLEQQEQM